MWRAAETAARNAHDFTAKVTVTGLNPGRWYFYRFIAPDGTTPSPVGRTRTLPEGPTSAFTLGVFSCSNFRFGHFNAYRHAAERNDLDLIIHTGDYFYEYEMGRYPSEEQALAGRDLMHRRTETMALADYWLRYATYRADPDLAALHRNFPMIARWDDHEITNNPWMGGAENHQPDEGDWEARKRAAMQAYQRLDAGFRCAMGQLSDRRSRNDHPARNADYRARVEQLDYANAVGDGSAIPESLAAFRDGPWSDEGRTILGAEQEAWLKPPRLPPRWASGTRWQILAQQIIMARLNFPLPLAEDIANSDQCSRSANARAIPCCCDPGRPTAQSRRLGWVSGRPHPALSGGARRSDANLLVLSGDSHNGWASDLQHDGANVGVEMAGHSVTSPGLKASCHRCRPKCRARPGRS